MVRWRNTCQRLAPSTMRGLDLVDRLRLERGQEHDEHERDPLPGVADHHGDAGAPGGGAQAKSPSPNHCQQGANGALVGVGEHPEDVGDAHRRDHHRDEEHDPEEAAAGQPLRAQEGQPEPDQVLHRHAAEDVDQRDAERAQLAAGAGGGAEQEATAIAAAITRRPTRSRCRRRAASRRPPARAPARRRRRRRTPSPRAKRHELAQEMELLRAEQQLLEVERADEVDGEAALGELEARQRQIERHDQREDRHRQHDQHRRQDEHRRRQPLARRRTAGRRRPRAPAVAAGCADAVRRYLVTPSGRL